MFIDEIKVYARAGHGGKGCVSFLREAYRPKGGPAGGNGGHGGDVILEADHDLNNLVAQYYQPRMLAKDGGSGMSKGKDGKDGKDLIVKVPCGTLVWRLRNTTPLPTGVTAQDNDTAFDSDAGEETEEDEDEAEGKSGDAALRLQSGSSRRPTIRHYGGVRAVELNLSEGVDEPVKSDRVEANRELICDLTTHGQRFVLCPGGRGGLGNRNFATSRNQTPRFAQPGEVGLEGEYQLELRTMAEVGLVGYPNAGKSTLLTAISKARPKIASYPFTTLTPQIGIIEYPDWHRLTVCDVPGLIDGAHLNVGLGHAFLRHIRRCRILVLLLDMAGTDGRAPWDDYLGLLKELELYDPSLLDLPRLVVANKMDETAAEVNLKAFKRKVRKVSVVQISAAFDVGIAEFKQLIRETVEPKTKG